MPTYFKYVIVGLLTDIAINTYDAYKTYKRNQVVLPFLPIYNISLPGSQIPNVQQHQVREGQEVPTTVALQSQVCEHLNERMFRPYQKSYKIVCLSKSDKGSMMMNFNSKTAKI